MLPSRVRVRDQDDTIPLAHVALGVETGGWTDASLFPLMIMQTLLGSWNRSHPGGANLGSHLVRVRVVGVVPGVLGGRGRRRTGWWRWGPVPTAP